MESAQNADHAIAEIIQNIDFSKSRYVTSTEAVLIAHHMKLWDWMETWPFVNATEEYAQETRCSRLMVNVNHAEIVNSLTSKLNNATDPIARLDQPFK